MNKSYRIKTETGDNAPKNIKIKLEQQYDTFEILSLTINQRDLYQAFNCDFGVLVGRVIANQGVGVPNAKISIFIPLSEDDELNPEIQALYPYKTPKDKNNDGKRYNLLPRVAETRPDGTIRPNQPFGSFPTKAEITTNDTLIEVYQKYYKYTTVTNASGDYMLFGVPVGVQTVHMSVDITDIGRFSMSPTTLINELGYSPNLFTDELKIKESSDLDDIPNIETQEISVDIIPFCGDSENFDIGITRQDFRIRAQIVSTFIVFGNVMNDGADDSWGNSGSGGVSRHYVNAGNANEVGSNRIGRVQEQIFSWNTNLSDAYINGATSDARNDMFLLPEELYTAYKRDGDFVFSIACNADRVVTGEDGSDVIVSNSSSAGAFTSFKGFMTIETPIDELPINPSFGIQYNFPDGIGGMILATFIAPVFRSRMRIPQKTTTLGSVLQRNETINSTWNRNWRNQYKKFEGGKIYSVAKFHPLVSNTTTGTVPSSQVNPNDVISSSNNNGGFLNSDSINDPTLNPATNVGALRTSGSTNNEAVQYPYNYEFGGNNYFGANWINFSLHMQNYSGIGNTTYSGVDYRGEILIFPTQFHSDMSTHFRTNSNGQALAGGISDTYGFPRSDLHYTDFIEVDANDINRFAEIGLKGFDSDQLLNNFSYPLSGSDYKNGSSDVPIDGGKDYRGNPNNVDPRTYFFKGLGDSDCIEFLLSLDVI